ncbi:DNA-directed RNA polymerase subunit L [Methanobrevibacter sp.]|uniref:DNA-directed RNA polymerase subunit L n=1 Tax=Methanobrevibacter sp. TaxID=66852 RepID=UPI0026E09074|nr:DNA-directed RNA polymerase subunit L [Methanobrevibacter sp.]
MSGEITEIGNTNIEIIEDKTLELTFIVHGESHGICNALRHNLMKNPDVEYAVYNIDHPLTGEPEMTIKTKRGKRPRIVLKQAAEELLEETDELKKLIEDNM